MLNKFARLVTRFPKNSAKATFFCQNSLHSVKVNKISYHFCQNKKTPSSTIPQNIPKQYLQIKSSQENIGEQKVQVHKTEGSISILSNLQGPNPQTSESKELYALMFTCNKCNTKQIRSFTKHAYHKGVVLIRCNGCEGVHLVADNLGWFEDQVTNVETMNQGKIKKVHDPIATVQFLKKAFEQDGEKEIKN